MKSSCFSRAPEQVACSPRTAAGDHPVSHPIGRPAPGDPATPPATAEASGAMSRASHARQPSMTLLVPSSQGLLVLQRVTQPPASVTRGRWGSSRGSKRDESLQNLLQLVKNGSWATGVLDGGMLALITISCLTLFFTFQAWRGEEGTRREQGPASAAC